MSRCSQAREARTNDDNRDCIGWGHAIHDLGGRD
jgi:hypothetical protein